MKILIKYFFVMGSFPLLFGMAVRSLGADTEDDGDYMRAGFTKFINNPKMPDIRRAKALLNRADWSCQKREKPIEALQDCLVVIDMPKAADEEKSRSFTMMAEVLDRYLHDSSLEKAMKDIVNKPDITPNTKAAIMCWQAKLHIYRTHEKLLDQLPHPYHPYVQKDHDKIGHDSRIEAIPIFNAAIEVAGISDIVKSEILLERGYAYFRQQKYDEAKLDFQAIIDMNGASDQQKKDSRTMMNDVPG